MKSPSNLSVLFMKIASNYSFSLNKIYRMINFFAAMIIGAYRVLGVLVNEKAIDQHRSFKCQVECTQDCPLFGLQDYSEFVIEQTIDIAGEEGKILSLCQTKVVKSTEFNEIKQRISEKRENIAEDAFAEIQENSTTRLGLYLMEYRLAMEEAPINGMHLILLLVNEESLESLPLRFRGNPRDNLDVALGNVFKKRLVHSDFTATKSMNDLLTPHHEWPFGYWSWSQTQPLRYPNEESNQGEV